jgi:hypothetical protein
MPKDVDEEIKDLYSDSTSPKPKLHQVTYEEAAENAEQNGGKVEPKKEQEAPKEHKSFAKLPDWANVAPSAGPEAAPAAPVEAPKVATVEAPKPQEAPKAVDAVKAPEVKPEADSNPFSYSVLTEHLSKK